MKQFIVFLAIFPFMMSFLVQFSCQQSSQYRLDAINEIVYNARESAAAEGYFSQPEIKAMKADIARAAGCSADDVEISVNDGIRYRMDSFDRREMMSCRVTVPIKNLIGSAGLFGAGSADDDSRYVIESVFPSERLM